ncbi:MAG: hypothetical protein U0807_02905 [Candidatus Binatia bacterium]
MRLRRGTAMLGVALALTAGRLPAARAAFVNFESGPVRPLALAPGGGLLLACNVPDNRLEIFSVTAGGLTLVGEVPVGLEPVAVAARAIAGGRIEAWVVNHLSDSVSIVEIDPGSVGTARVKRTLLVGDEPRDVLFAGSGGTRVFVTTAHRGQARPGDPQLTTAGVKRADVWVFDADALGAALGGTPLTIVELFGDTPRALAKSPDGATVYAAVFQSGNRTTTINESVVTANGGLPPPPIGATPNAPHTGLIVKFNPSNNRWEDEIARNWTASVPFTLPDQDVFLIDANGAPPAQIAGSAGVVAGVGTVLFNMAVRPDNGKLYVSNTDARNHVRFEPIVRGHLAESRITVVNGTTPSAVHLNSHVNYAITPGPSAEVAESLAFPTDMQFTPDGQTLFVAAFGSGAVGVLSTATLEAGAAFPRAQVAVGGGPAGLAYDGPRDRLYVLNRFDNTISIVGNAAQASRGVTGTVSLRFDPSPAIVKNGRRFLYDARSTSGHGDSACASCHIFGDFDSLAWDLGDPFGTPVANPNPFRLGSGGPFHPMKGPMTTQSLRGMANAGPMHWRGDRTDPADPLNEDHAFKKFNPAFVGLLGSGSQLDDSAMQAFTDFVLTVQYPPNPIRAIDNSLTAAQSAGSTFYNTVTVDTTTCQNCHRLPLGTDGFSSFEGEPQEFKIAHLRNLYQKVGMFGFPSGGPLPGTGFQGDQVRGFGFLHDGSVATVFLFLNAPVFNFANNTQRRNVEAFALAFDTGLRPMVGQQVSATPTTFSDATVIARIDLMIARANAGDCDLVVKGNLGGVPRGARHVVGSNNFQPDRNADAVVDKTTLRGLAATPGQEITYTCVPPGLGTRIGVDRDEDGFFDRTEIEAATDPADPLSFPGSPTTTITTTSTSTSTSTSTTTSTTLPTVPVSTAALSMRDDSVTPNAARRRLAFTSKTKNDPSNCHVAVPASGGPGDPTLHGATVRVQNAAGGPDDVTVTLGTAGWTALGGGKGWRFKSPDPSAACQAIAVKADRLSVKCGKALWGYTLDEPTQGAVRVCLTLGVGTRWCALADTPRVDERDKFQARKVPNQASCP